MSLELKRPCGLGWLTKKIDSYSPALVQEFYVAYIATILKDLRKKKKPLDQPQLLEVLVRGRWVNISEETIHHVQFGPTYRAPKSTAEFDH